MKLTPSGGAPQRKGPEIRLVNYANINTKSKQIWVYDNANYQLVNGKPFLSIIKSANS